MTDKVQLLLAEYDQLIQAQRIDPVRHANPMSRQSHLEHLRWMLRVMLGFEGTPRDPVESWSERKLNRWLGFVQGQLQMLGLVSLQTLRDQTRDLYED